MRDNGDYRAANTRAQAAILPPPPRLALRPWRRFSRRFATGRAKSCPRPYLRPPQLHGHPLHWYPFQWYGYHSYGMHSQWNGLVCNALLSIPYQWIAIDCLARRATGWGKRPTSPGALSLQLRQRHKSPGGENHAQLRCRRRPTGTARPRSPHRPRQDPLPHRRPGLLSPPHHQGRGRAGGGQAPGVIPVMSSTAIPVVS